MRAPFGRVLIVNRGEIAVRLIRACQELGARAIAVYSEADHGALHTRLADEAHLLGPPPASESYLNIERVLDVARRTGAEALHPGYGFLSENPAFAEACAAAGLAFVGPPPNAMRLMGDKAAARRLVAEHGVAIVPGYDDPDQADETLLKHARGVGFPLLIKAATGGGGRGMRVVREAEGFGEALQGARREARAAFGHDTIILERYISPARHVEVQVLGDQQGALIHLGERDCSVQRRHQKVIEESPSPAVSPELRTALGEAAVRVARAAGYWNAGTCEFLLDEHGQFYFIEMNTRLQVEHPVTELVTGLDLVQRQLAIAAGLPLGLSQDDVVLRGHAIECRLYAEDPAHDYQPSAGRLERFEPPPGHGLRHDVGYAAGDRVNTYYDAMLAKLVAFGEDRATALARAGWAVERYVVSGVATNLPLLRWVLAHPTFSNGQATTDFLAREWRPPSGGPAPAELLAGAAAFELSTPVAEPSADPWRSSKPWRLLEEGVVLAYQGETSPRAVVASRAARPCSAGACGGAAIGSAWSVSVEGQTYLAVAEADGRVSVNSGERRWMLRVSRVEGGVIVADGESTFRLARALPPSIEATSGQSVEPGGPTRLEAPMPGRVVKVAVREGQQVREHQTLLVLEAMKIEHTVAAPRDGTVQAVRCREGDTVEGGAVLVELASSE